MRFINIEEILQGFNKEYLPNTEFAKEVGKEF